MEFRWSVHDGSRGQTEDKGYIYTKKCGWVDLKHASPGSTTQLWRKLKNDTGADYPLDRRYRVVRHSMTHLNQFGIFREYAVKKGLTLAQRKSVALGIYLNLSFDFESYQGNAFWGKLIPSSFSVEDLISNLISFYRALEPDAPIIEMCEPVSKEQALFIWDTYKPAWNDKSRELRPVLYPMTKGGTPRYGDLPDFLNTVIPMPIGESFWAIPCGRLNRGQRKSMQYMKRRQEQ